MSLVFRGRHHYLDGKHAPGVNTIINCLDKPALPRWAAKTVAEYVVDNPEAVADIHAKERGVAVAQLSSVPWQRRDEAADEGIKFHEALDKLLAGEDFEVSESLTGKIEAAKDFITNHELVPVVSEVSCASREHWYAGRLDLVADMTVRGKRLRVILDWKSGKRLYPRLAWQLAAYGMSEIYVGTDGIERNTSDLGITHAFGVHIRDDGYGLHQCKYGKEVFQQFADIARVYRHNKACTGNWKQEGSGYLSVDLAVGA